MKEEIRQNGKVILSSDDGVSISMFFNNLCGKNFSGEKYRIYLQSVAFGDMGTTPTGIDYDRFGRLIDWQIQLIDK